MALDRQKILNELGSVMNQLKNTDCGCMGKLFGDSGQNITQTGNGPTCGRYMQGCGHGHHHGYSNSMSNNTQNFHPSCMGQCNPPKLYADTYNYLSKNLMQPTVNEVYNDLKNITPANSIMNNPLAQQMGLSNQNAVQPTMSSMPPHMENQNVLSNMNTGNMAANSGFNSNMKMGHMGGMGPQIMNMFGENKPTKSNNMVPQATPMALPTSNQFNSNEHSAFIAQSQNTNHLQHQLKQQPIENVQPVGNMKTNFGLPLQSSPINHHHGQHAQGMEKFKEMFPKAMKNDLGFDPMQIAIQMNPDNHKKVAIDTLHKMMNNNNITPPLKPNDNSAVVNGHVSNSQNNAQPNLIQGNVFPNEVLQSTQAPAVLHQQANPQMQFAQQPAYNISQINNQPIPPNQKDSQQSPNAYGAYGGQTNLNAYTALSPSPLLDQQQQSPHFARSIPEPHSSAVVQSNLPDVYKDFDPNKLQIQPEISNTNQIIKEPIFPADTTKFEPRQKNYEFNTLGQPIEMLPAKIYRTTVPDLPQTLSPQVTTNPRNDLTQFSNVKSTISKTSLMGNKPIGKTPSRNQLQHIYNQYKGSQSFTNQNIKDNSNKDITRSDGRLNVQHANLNEQQMPIENVGGDTAANNRLNYDRANKLGHINEQIGDAPITKQTNNGPETLSPADNRKCRNGLQDMVYTAYTTSAAWSFHGHDRAAPHPTGYRYRN